MWYNISMKLWPFAQKTEAEETASKVTDAVINDAFIRREKDIRSLREYDQGLKEIHAPTISEIVSDLRKSS